MAVDIETSRVPLTLNEERGYPLTRAFFGVEGANNADLIFPGRKESIEGVIETDIPLGLGPSSVSSWVPSEVAGLNPFVFDGARLCPNAVLGRLRVCSDCGLMPDPTLAEKELFEVFREAEEFDREDAEEEKDVLRPIPAFTVALTAELTALDEVGAGCIFLMGSPAASANVLLFGAGSGTWDNFVRT
jgi:hypothetical protein